MDIVSIVIMGITGFVIVTFCVYFCHWSTNRGSRRANATGTCSRSGEQPTVPVLHTRSPPCNNQDVEQGMRVGRPITPLALGSLYPLPRQPPYPEILDIINSNNNSNNSNTNAHMDAPPSYDEAMTRSQIPSAPVVNTISASIMSRATSIDDKERR